MQLKSLGYQTELLFRRFEGEIIERPDYLVTHRKILAIVGATFLSFKRHPKKAT
jgi:hypothetical protein